MNLFDIAIVGASISGASLGACLGMESVEVALIEKDRFPRRKACGEGLSNIALEAMNRMGLKTDRAIASGVPYFGYRVDLGNSSFPFANGGRRSLRGIGIERYQLDTEIVEQACQSPSVTPYFEASINLLERTAAGYRVGFSDGEALEARFLVLADGANSPCANRLGIPKVRKDPPLWGISFILEGNYAEPLEEVVVLLKDGFEINCTPVSASRLNVTFLTDRKNVKALQKEENRSHFLSEACEKCGFHGSPLEAPLQVGPVSSTRRPYYRDSVMLLGDAAETLDPVAGMGMTHGILMAEIASKALVDTLIKGCDETVALQRYAEHAEIMSRPFRGFTRLTASLMRSPARRFLLPPLASSFLPGVIRSALDELPDFPISSSSLPNRFLSQVGA